MKPDTLATLSAWIMLAAKRNDLPEAAKSWDGDAWQWDWFDRRSGATRRLSLLVRENDEELFLSVIGSAWSDSPRKSWANTFLTVPLPPDPTTDAPKSWLESAMLKAWNTARDKADKFANGARAVEKAG
ncbi:MAG: hypothetical protein WD557_03610 [Dehalococcoidia bacterium]